MTEQSTTPAVKKSRQPKSLAPFVVGRWEGNNFVASAKQPDKPVTDLAGIVDWAKRTFGEEPGVYEFARRQPGKLTLAAQTTMKAILG